MERAPPLLPPVPTCRPQHDAAARQLLLHEVGEAVLVNLEQKASVLEVLEALLEGEGMEEMDFKVADGGIVIGMSYELHELVVRVYDVREFATLGVEPDELIEELESEIDSEDGALEYVAGLLLVLKIESAQDDVLALLEEIRDRE